MMVSYIKRGLLMRPVSEECVVGGGLALTLQVSRVCGVAPVRLTRIPDGWRVALHIPTQYYGYCIMILLHFSIGVGLITDLINTSSQLVVSVNIWLKVIEAILFLITISIGVIEAPTRIKSLIEHLNICDRIQLTTRPINYQKKKEIKMYKVALLIVITMVNYVVEIFQYIALILFYIPGASVYYKGFHKMLEFRISATWLGSAGFFTVIIILGIEITMAVGSFYTSFLSYILGLQFVLLALRIESALDCVNDSVNELIHTLDSEAMPSLKSNLANVRLISNKQPMNILTDFVNIEHYRKREESQTYKRALQTVDQLSRAFGKICNLIRSADNGQGRLLFLILSLIFIYMLSHAYFLLNILLQGYRIDYKTFLLLGHVLCRVMQLMILVEPGYRTQRELDRSRVLVSQLFRRVSSAQDPLATQVEYFYKQIQINQDVSYSPVGLCTLSRYLTSVMLASVFTYLVIFLQFNFA